MVSQLDAPRWITDASSFLGIRDAALSQTYVSIGPRRTASPHEFYRYPAKFIPDFARTVIGAFTGPGELVVDPFVGGGTTLVEAMLAGRQSVGSDLNELATFVSEVKTTVLRGHDIRTLGDWTDNVLRAFRQRRKSTALDDWRAGGYLKELDARETWRLRALIATAIDHVGHLGTRTQQQFARCVLLRTAQWALDMRSDVPTTGEFREAFAQHAFGMLEVAGGFPLQLPRPYYKPTVLKAPLPGLSRARAVSGTQPRLILTSPPYPGVYVNYHRWKYLGRREMPAPYWIADRQDGRGIGHYTMGARADRTSDIYFRRLEDAFHDLASLMGPDTLLVQMVGFNNIGTQFQRYLTVMRRCGLTEIAFPQLATARDGRLWRSVPFRRWWTTTTTLQEIAPHTSQEVVLFHRLGP
jgi:hypothetical protein